MPKPPIFDNAKDHLSLKEVPQPVPKPSEVLLKVVTAALNHRDLYIRQNLYPSISFENPILADGCAIVLPHPEGAIASHTFLPGQRVVINPGTGWTSDLQAPKEHIQLSAAPQQRSITRFKRCLLSLRITSS